ncbi:MAG: winged helix-turn-helix transcriptional regulator [Desulfurococcales archaeon]|nr:winged helix-turn-helix transcriptional regulator [Desulfurococcales archaeon]
MSVDRKVLAFIKENPGSNPREIADALGIPYGTVRSAIMRLREAGYLIRSSRGGYVVRAGLPQGLEDELSTPKQPLSSEDFKALAEAVNELRALIESLEERVSKLEKELDLLRKGLTPNQSRKSVAGFEDLLKERGVVRASQASKLSRKPIDAYVREGRVVAIGDLLVSPSFLNAFKSRFPLRVSEVRGLKQEERELLNAMIREGLVYLHGGREYRLVD